MSHEVRYGTYPEKVDRKKVQASWDNVAMHEGYEEGASGLYADIRWIEYTVCESYEDAMRFIKENDRGGYDQLAVRYKEAKVNKYPEKINRVAEKLKKLNNRFRELDEKKHYQDVKSAYVSCRTCGSKLNREYLLRTAMVKNGNYCPVCRNDLRPETVTATLKRLKQDIEFTGKELEELQKEYRSKQKYEVKWLVKVEYHV